MIWLAWRQHRRQALFTLLGLAALAALMIPTGLAMRHTFAHEGLAGCLDAIGTGPLAKEQSGTCNRAFSQFTTQYKNLALVGALFVFLPLLIGLFWGAPLVAREIEQGTHRLVWTQGVSRRRWALVKIGLVGGATLAAAIVYGLGMSWWWSPLSRSGGAPKFTNLSFDVQGVAPIGYTLFAIALGVAAGTVWQKVLPAMAVSVVGFAGVRIATTVLARVHYLPAKELTAPLVNTTGVAPNSLNGDWVISMGIRNAAGRIVDDGSWRSCTPRAGTATCPGGDKLGYGAGAYNWEQYQPASRFWAFQAIETGLFVALAALLLYFAIRRVRRIA